MRINTNCLLQTLFRTSVIRTFQPLHVALGTIQGRFTINKIIRVQKRLERKVLATRVLDLERRGDRFRVNFDFVRKATIVFRVLTPNSPSRVFDIFQFQLVGDTSSV